MHRQAQGPRFSRTRAQAVGQIGVSQAQIDAQVIQLQSAQPCHSPVTERWAGRRSGARRAQPQLRQRKRGLRHRNGKCYAPGGPSAGGRTLDRALDRACDRACDRRRGAPARGRSSTTCSVTRWVTCVPSAISTG